MTSVRPEKEKRDANCCGDFILLRSSSIDWRGSDKDYDPLSRNNTDLIVLFQWISFIRQSAVSRLTSLSKCRYLFRLIANQQGRERLKKCKVCEKIIEIKFSKCHKTDKTTRISWIFLSNFQRLSQFPFGKLNFDWATQHGKLLLCAQKLPSWRQYFTLRTICIVRTCHWGDKVHCQSPKCHTKSSWYHLVNLISSPTRPHYHVACLARCGKV